MEAKGLNINDWVLYNNTPKQVVYIYCRPLPDGTNQANEVGFTHNEEEWVNASNVEPIPITEETLDINGFKNKTPFLTRKTLTNEFGCNRSVVYIIHTKRVRIYNCNTMVLNIKCKYVHELQHALRVCGLDDVADNFKLQAL